MGVLIQPAHLIVLAVLAVVVFLVCRVLWRLGSKLSK